MVQLETRTLDAVLEQWRDVTRAALQAGASEKDLQAMLKTEVADSQEHHCETCSQDSHGPETVYLNLPAGLIDLPTAAKRYDLNVRTMSQWVRRGRVALRGRLRAPKPGGGYLVVCEDELVTFIQRPKNKGGRPRLT